MSFNPLVDKIYTGKTETPGETIMTIGIGLLCDNGRSAIMIADREMSQPAIPGLGFFYRNKMIKYKAINEKSVVVFSGPVDNDILSHYQISDNLEAKEIVEKLSASYVEIRKSRIENFILSPLGIDSLSAFLQKGDMQPSVSIEILKQIQAYNLSCEFLLVNCDKSGCHLFHVANPGSYVSYDEAGYRSIGIGSFVADSVIAHYKYSKETRYEEALKIGIEAKKRSEVILGVGPETDARKISIEGIEEINF